MLVPTSLRAIYRFRRTQWIPNATVDIIVQYVSKPGNTQFAKILKMNGIIKNHLDLVNGAVLTVPVSILPDLASASDVTYITPDRTVQNTSNGNSTATLDYYDATTNATTGWQLGYSGTGIGVAIIDSGIASTADLGSRVVYSMNFVGGTSGSANDQYGHGTHVAGIVGGSGAVSTGSQYSYTFKGIAPNVNIINLRVLDQNGSASDSTVIAAIQQAIPPEQYNIRVINLSMGRASIRELHHGSFVPGGRAGLEGRHRRGGGGGQLRPRQFQQQQRLCNHHRARQ